LQTGHTELGVIRSTPNSTKKFHCHTIYYEAQKSLTNCCHKYAGWKDQAISICTKSHCGCI